MIYNIIKSEDGDLSGSNLPSNRLRSPGPNDLPKARTMMLPGTTGGVISSDEGGEN